MENIISNLKKHGQSGVYVIYYKTKQNEDMSSTCIRKKIKNGEEILDYLNQEVAEYIKKNKLY